MSREEDFSAEDDKETQDWVGNTAQSEYKRVLENLKRQHRREKLLFMRSIGRVERKRLKQKYGS